MRRGTLERGGLVVAALLGALSWGCGEEGADGDLTIVANSKAVPIDEGSGAPGAVPDDPAMMAAPNGPILGAVQMLVSIYARPDHRAEKVGYLRLGTRVTRAEKAAAFDSCQSGFYNILPHGYVCLDDGATTDMEHPLMRANIPEPDRTKPLPYHYAFVRAVAPRYYRLPSKKEQFEYEMSLDKHLRSFQRLRDEWNAVDVGANDVRMTPNGVVLGPAPDAPPAMNAYEKFGGDGTGEVPWYFDGKRHIPNVASFKVPDYAVITNRVKRHSGVALVNAFAGDERDFALTTDLRLVPISKLKPGRGSTFHGVELTEGWELPVGFIKVQAGARKYEKDKKGRYKTVKQAFAYGTPVQLTGDVSNAHGSRWVQTEDGLWMRSRDLAIAPLVSKLPAHAKKGAKWIDLSIQRQILVLYEGTTPVFATMVSTGKDGLGDHKKTHSTPRGTFRIRDKHVTTTMDSQIVGEEFELMDVPHVQYFHAGYALHAAYWHGEYGRPRSHGCVNLSPIDAYRVFQWTEPQLPQHWHSVGAGETMGEGTLVHIHP
jgi:lipoprotein-anchoring transpeptidase ErfK/SrfK